MDNRALLTACRTVTKWIASCVTLDQVRTCENAAMRLIAAPHGDIGRAYSLPILTLAHFQRMRIELAQSAPESNVSPITFKPTTMQKARIEILDWIASLYTRDTRSVINDGSCVYNGPDGRHCAFAMMCKNPADLVDDGPEWMDASAIALRKPELMREEFAGHPPLFYHACQDLHDDADNWDEAGLSAIGQKQLSRLKEEWA